MSIEIENYNDDNNCKLVKSKIFLNKLISYYTYEYVINYLLNPNKFYDKKLEKYFKKIISEIGIDCLADILYNKTFSHHSNTINTDYFTENQLKSKIYSNNEIKNKYVIKEKENINENNNIIINLCKKEGIKIFENQFFNNNDNKNNISDIEIKEISIKDNYSDELINDDSDITINVQKSVEEISKTRENRKENKNINKEKESSIILNEENSYVYSIIYKELINENENIYYYYFENFNEDQTINMKCIDNKCQSKGIYNISNKQIKIIFNHNILYEEHCYLKDNFGDEMNLNIIDFIKDNPIKGIEILKSKKMNENKINEENKGKIEKEIVQNKIENNIHQINEIKNEDINSEEKNNLEGCKTNFNGKNGIELNEKDNTYHFIDFKIKEVNKFVQNNYSKKKEGKKRENKNININFFDEELNNIDASYNNSIYKSNIDIDNDTDDISVLSVISNYQNKTKEKIINDNVDRNDYDFLFDLYGKKGMEKVNNIYLLTEDLEKKKNFELIKKNHDKELKELLKRKKYKRKEEKRKEKNKKEKRKLFEIIYDSSSVINLNEEEDENIDLKILNIKKDKSVNKKSPKSPLFQIVNQNKNTPKFITSNCSFNNKSKNKNNNNIINSNQNLNKFFKNEKKSHINKILNNKNNNKFEEINKYNIHNEENLQFNEYFYKNNNENNKNKKINENNNDYKKHNNKFVVNNNCFINEKKIVNKEDEKNRTNINNKNNNLNIKYKILIKKTIKKTQDNNNNNYLEGYESNENKNEATFIINNKILYINEHITHNNIKFGFHFHKNEDGVIFNYFPFPFQTSSNFIEFKCYLKDCDSKAYYHLKDKKFEMIKDHSKSKEFHYISFYNNFIFKKIIEFMKDYKDIKDLQFISE